MKKYKHRREGLISNPSFDKPVRPPFIHSIETTEQHRVYNFQPHKKRKFQIVVEFPIEYFGDLFIEVAGRVAPDVLLDAINFVTDNEHQFANAFENSQDDRPREQIELSEKSFQEL